MNNFLLYMIICLNGTSPELKYYEKILREFSINFGYHLQIDGNPFEYKKLENILQICQKLNITDIGLRTNENVTEKNMKLIKKYNIRSIMYKDGNKHLIHNIALAQNYNISTEISVVLSKNNIHDIDKIIKKCKENKINLLVLERSIISKYRNQETEPLGPEEYKYIMNKIIKHNQNQEKPGIALSHCPNKILLHKDNKYDNNIGGCSAGIISCAIDINGNIIPCLPLYKIILGNIQENSLYEIWEKSGICIKLRDRNNLKGKCGACVYKSLCGGCRAESFYLTGDLFNEDKTCWKV